MATGASPQTQLGELRALPRPPSWLVLRAPTSKGWEGKDGRGKGRGKGEEERGGLKPSQSQITGYVTVSNELTI